MPDRAQYTDDDASNHGTASRVGHRMLSMAQNYINNEMVELQKRLSEFEELSQVPPCHRAAYALCASQRRLMCSCRYAVSSPAA